MALLGSLGQRSRIPVLVNHYVFAVVKRLTNFHLFLSVSIHNSKRNAAVASLNVGFIFMLLHIFYVVDITDGC